AADLTGGLLLDRTVLKLPRLGCLAVGPSTYLASGPGTHQSVMHPVLGHRRPVAAAALGALVFVVGEDQIETAAMDIERLAQVVVAHRRALDMPPGPALAPGARPARFPRLGRFPKGEIAGRAFFSSRVA